MLHATQIANSLAVDVNTSHGQWE